MSYTIPDEAIINFSENVGPIDNVVNTSFNSYCKDCSIGVYIYKSSKAISGYIRSLLEVNRGAHYYLQTAERTDLSTASCVVDLSQVTIDPKNNRRGFIALSFISKGSAINQCDIGIACDTATGGRGKWYLSCWCRDFSVKNKIVSYPWSENTNFKAVETDAKTFIPDGRKVRITISVAKNATTKKDIIVGTIVDVDSVKTYGEIKFEVPSGVAFTNASSTPKLRFERFISFVPALEGKDDKDYSTLNARIYDCRLNGGAWGDSDKDIEYCWSVQGANIGKLHPSTLAYDPATHKSIDEIEIYHQYKLH